MASDYLNDLLTTGALREPALKAAIRSLDLPPDSQGLDVGCGAGLQCLLLAGAVGLEGRVTGLDVSKEFLAHGEKLVREAGMAERIDFKEGSAAALPFDDDRFNWAWSCDCVGYGPWKPMPMIEEMGRVVRPGGKVALLAWSSEQLLPGHPLLEARLRATTPGLAPFSTDLPPERHFHRALGWFRALGFGNLAAHAFAGSVHAPLSGGQRQAMAALFKMRWPGVEDELSEGDRAEFSRLCTAGSPDYIIDHPDYCALFTYALFSGTVA